MYTLSLFWTIIGVLYCVPLCRKKHIFNFAMNNLMTLSLQQAATYTCIVRIRHRPLWWLVDLMKYFSADFLSLKTLFISWSHFFKGNIICNKYVPTVYIFYLSEQINKNNSLQWARAIDNVFACAEYVPKVK